MINRPVCGHERAPYYVMYTPSLPQTSRLPHPQSRNAKCSGQGWILPPSFFLSLESYVIRLLLNLSGTVSKPGQLEVAALLWRQPARACQPNTRTCQSESRLSKGVDSGPQASRGTASLNVWHSRITGSLRDRVTGTSKPSGSSHSVKPRAPLFNLCSRTHCLSNVFFLACLKPRR